MRWHKGYMWSNQEYTETDRNVQLSRNLWDNLLFMLIASLMFNVVFGILLWLMY